ncbi:MAG: bifunctional UDP-sugar hydrolase/5'-nucleotidase [Candidatus Aminicenantes bacterium]
MNLFSIKKVFPLVLVLVFTWSAGCQSSSEKIVLIHTNDTHGIFKPYEYNINGEERLVGGMEATSHYLNKIKTEEKNVLVIEKGDLLTGTLAAELEYKGVGGGMMMEFLNRLDYDIWCFGNHDFDKGQENALDLSELANFPTVMANIVYKESGELFPVKPYHIFKIGGIRVGIIAVMEERFLIEVEKEKVKDLDVLPIVPTLNSYVPELDERTDLIVILSHGWFDEGLRIARNVPGIDIVLAAAEDGKFKDINGVLVQSIRGHQKTLGYIKVEVKNDRIVSYEQQLIWMWADVDLKPSAKVSALVREVDAAIGEEYTKVIGEAKVDLSFSYYPKEILQPESSLGNWITDVMRWRTGSQIALHNSGAIRADIKAGYITKGDIFDVAPFRNILVVFKLTAQQIKDVLEHDVERGWDRLQVSGIKYKYYPKDVRPFGERIVYMEIGGEVIEKDGKMLKADKVYTVVSNDYLVGHAKDKYFGFTVNNSHNTGQPLDKAMMEWLEKHKFLDYKIEGRIVEINSSH